MQVTDLKLFLYQSSEKPFQRKAGKKLEGYMYIV